MKIDDNAETFGPPLTAKEIEWFDAINRDNIAAKRAFGVAYNYYMNRLAEQQKKTDEFWDQIGKARGLDPLNDGLEYRLKRVRGNLSIVAETEEEKKERLFKESNQIF